jgi:hypothetical protein
MFVSICDADALDVSIADVDTLDVFIPDETLDVSISDVAV